MQRVLLNQMEQAIEHLKTYIRSRKHEHGCPEILSETSRFFEREEVIQSVYVLTRSLLDLGIYYTCWKHILKKRFLNEAFQVVSIGCGCCVEYLALALACEEEAVQWDYLGIDPINWAWKPVTNNLRLLHIEFSNVNTKLLSDRNILFFPKTYRLINHFQKAVLKEIISQTAITQSRIILVHSTPERTSDSFETITEAFCRKGYTIRYRSNLNGFDGYPVDTMVENVSCNTLKYPEHILYQLKDLDTVIKNTWSRTGTEQTIDILPIFEYRADAMHDEIIFLENSS